MKVTGKVGKLRIMDSASIIANGSADNMSVFVYDDSGPSFTDKTTEASADDTGYTGTFWVDSPETVKAGTLLGKQIVAEIRLQSGAKLKYLGIIVGIGLPQTESTAFSVHIRFSNLMKNADFDRLTKNK